MKIGKGTIILIAVVLYFGVMAVINVNKDKDINKEIQIINSYENYQREWNAEIKKEYMNEEEIKKCEIRINDKLIPFTYLYKFTNKGKYIIKYSFYNYLSKTNYMFSHCSSLTNIDLSNFNTQNVTDMSWMFSWCSSLTNINLSNFNTQNVTNMSWMFSGCSSLKKENIITKDNRIINQFQIDNY